MVGLLRMNEPVDYFRFLVSSAKKTAAFFSISRSSRKRRTARRSLRNSARSSESRLPELPVPLAPPSSGSLSHRFSETTLTPRSVAISLVLLPLSRTRRTASTLNSCGYEANRLVLIIRHVPSEHPSSSSYMSTKTGELQDGWKGTTSTTADHGLTLITKTRVQFASKQEKTGVHVSS